MSPMSVSKVTQIEVHADKQEVTCSVDVTMPEKVLDCFPDGPAPAIASTIESESTMTFSELRAFLQEGGEALLSEIPPKSVVGVMLPNGPECAVALLLCMFKRTAAPLNPRMSVQDMVSSFQLFQVKHCLVMEGNDEDNENIKKAASETNCQLVYVKKSGTTAGLIVNANPKSSSANATSTWTAPDDTALFLQTSGTTSKPKVVPLTIRAIYTGAVCIASILGLTSEDKCLNVLQLTHIGGISRCLLASLVSGSQVICAPTFSPGSFIEQLDQLKPTWYSAVPTIHKAMILFCKRSGAPTHNLRMIETGAANLPHVDAVALRELFKCKVYPTYAMSECMPISNVLPDYDLSKPGSVGVPIGVSLKIVDEAGQVLPMGQPGQPGQTGELCVRGPACFGGYLGNPEANKTCFVGDENPKWFSTGDVGYVDSDGYIFLTGRSKELIKRGGEQVSPFEVEEALMKHPAVDEAVVFGIENAFWGEEVAAVVVAKKDSVTEKELMEFVAGLVLDIKVPKQIAIIESVDQLPKTASGKYIRRNFATHLGLKAADTAALKAMNGGEEEEEGEGCMIL